ncbi:YceK/YidQ family lipoprotein [Citrifermentans bremense]|uniref:YceK/YidQ family lipoprotein n=1 Tax=Citrifermentans bremense TaxID=60035 RepID=UPI001CF78268
MPRIFSGTAVDICGLAADNLGIFALVDLPLSLVGDTLMFPYTYYTQSKYGDISVKTPCASKSGT